MNGDFSREKLPAAQLWALARRYTPQMSYTVIDLARLSLAVYDYPLTEIEGTASTGTTACARVPVPDVLA